MRIGLHSPVVTRVPGQHSPWEVAATVADLVDVARAADRLGLHHLTCSEHVAVPAAVAETRGGTYWDPLATLSYLAAVTQRVRLLTHVLVLGYHHPVALAKRYGTLDLLSGGRLVLGVGVGSLEEEFALLGQPFADRGPRADASLEVLRATLSRERPGHPGLEALVVSPHAVQDPVPVWVGGRTGRSLRRALEHGHGWAPFGLAPAQVAELLAAADLPAGFEVVLGAARPVDPLGDPDGLARVCQVLADAGATVLNLAVRADGKEHYLEQLEALASFGEKYSVIGSGRD